MRIIKILALSLFAPTLLGACSSNDEENSVTPVFSMTGKWVMENDPEQYAYCYSDGGIGACIVTDSYRKKKTYYCGKFSSNGNTITYEMMEDPIYDNRLLYQNSGYTWMQDEPDTYSVNWLNDERTAAHVGNTTFRKTVADFEYWTQKDLIGVWQCDDYKIVFAPDWKMRLFEKNNPVLHDGGYMHVARPTDKGIMLAYYYVKHVSEDDFMNGESKLSVFFRCEFEWTEGHTEAVIGGYTFTKTSGDWKSEWGK